MRLLNSPLIRKLLLFRESMTSSVTFILLKSSVMHGIIAKSAEHAYNYVKAIRRGSPEIAQTIKDAPTAALAKQAAKRLPFDPKWKDEKVQVMRDILSSKRDQVPEFKQALVDSKQNKIVEAVPWDFFWDIGLSKK